MADSPLIVDLFPQINSNQRIFRDLLADRQLSTSERKPPGCGRAGLALVSRIRSPTSHIGVGRLLNHTGEPKLELQTHSHWKMISGSLDKVHKGSSKWTHQRSWSSKFAKWERLFRLFLGICRYPAVDIERPTRHWEVLSLTSDHSVPWLDNKRAVAKFRLAKYKIDPEAVVRNLFEPLITNWWRVLAWFFSMSIERYCLEPLMAGHHGPANSWPNSWFQQMCSHSNGRTEMKSSNKQINR